MRTKKRITNTKDWIDYVSKLHNNKYDYSKSVFIGAHKEITITCPIHGDFIQKANNHKYGRGCYRCSRRYKLHYSDFLERCNERVDMVKYKIVDGSFKNSEDKLEVICDIHGVFKITPHHFLSGKGCPKCGMETIRLKNRTNPTGWSITNWELRAKESKQFDSFKVYIIRCWDESEEFYKIGRTYRKTDARFKSFPYKYEIIKEIVFYTAKEAFNKETELKRLHKEYKYLPETFFNGRYECYKKLSEPFAFTNYID